jgi:pimeloyl-ACP methyl ester carboxylesterase
MEFPTGLHVIEQLPRTPTARQAPFVVLVHGSLDRAESFRRVIRRLDECHVVAYDRRGYHRSRGNGVADLDGHIEDLLAILKAAAAEGEPLACVIGHSLGGDVVMGAALAEPTLVCAIGLYEPPMPWLGFRRTLSDAEPTAPTPDEAAAVRPWPPMADDPAEEAERFFRRMVGDAAWERLSEGARSERRNDGPALVADLRAIRGPVPFEVTALQVPALFGRGGKGSASHHRLSVEWLAHNVPGATLYEIDGATHGAHLSHPDAFAEFVRHVVRRCDERTEPAAEPEAGIA